MHLRLRVVETTLTFRRADDPRVPVQLLVFATQTAITTSTCIADYMSWTGFSSEQKLELGKLYVPYLALCKFGFALYLGA